MKESPAVVFRIERLTRRRVGKNGAQLGKERHELGSGGREVVRGERRRCAGRERANEVEKRGVRVCAVGLEAGALQRDEAERVRALDHRADVARLADPRLAGDEQCAPVRVARAVERVESRGQRRVATDENRTDDTLLDEHSAEPGVVMMPE